MYYARGAADRACAPRQEQVIVLSPCSRRLGSDLLHPSWSLTRGSDPSIVKQQHLSDKTPTEFSSLEQNAVVGMRSIAKKNKLQAFSA